MAYNAADEDQVKERERKERTARDRELDEMRTLLAVPEFRRFMWRYLGRCKVFETVFNSHGGLMNLNEGMRQVGLQLLAEVNDADPQALVTMMTENKQA